MSITVNRRTAQPPPPVPIESIEVTNHGSGSPWNLTIKRDSGAGAPIMIQDDTQTHYAIFLTLDEALQLSQHLLTMIAEIEQGL